MNSCIRVAVALIVSNADFIGFKKQDNKFHKLYLIKDTVN